MNYILLFFVLGMLCDRYIFPVLDALLEVFQCKQAEKITVYQLKAQEHVVLFNRKYPDQEQEELAPAIGFTYERPDDEYDYEEDRKSR